MRHDFERKQEMNRQTNYGKPTARKYFAVDALFIFIFIYQLHLGLCPVAVFT
jgi:hypothetical protein